MSSAGLAADPLDDTALHAIMIRWQLAERYLVSEADDAGKMALHILVWRDIPTLVRELVRLRPDLSLTPTPTETE